MFGNGDHNFMDLRSFNHLTHYTAGKLYTYQNYNKHTSPEAVCAKFRTELKHALTLDTSFEMSLRVRASEPIRLGDFYGNFTALSENFVSIPKSDVDTCITIRAHIEEPIKTSDITIQAACLYTTSDGLRKVRIITAMLPVVDNVCEVLQGIDTLTVMHAIPKMAANRAIESQYQNCVDALENLIIDSSVTYQKEVIKSTHSLQYPSHLAPLPMYVHALLKSNLLHKLNKAYLDTRALDLYYFNSLSAELMLCYVYPRLMIISDMTIPAVTIPAAPLDPGTRLDPNPDHQPNTKESLYYNFKNMRLPPSIILTQQYLNPANVYLLYNVKYVILFIGLQVQQQTLQQLFNLNSMEEIPNEFRNCNNNIPIVDNHLNKSLRTIIHHLTTKPTACTPELMILKQNNRNHSNYFNQFLKNDRTDVDHSYSEFLKQIEAKKDKALKNSN